MPGGLGAFSIALALAAFALALLLVWVLSRDRAVERTSFGFYIERKRFEDGPFEPGMPPSTRAVLPSEIPPEHGWPDRKEKE